MSRHYLANDVNRLLSWKVNRSISRGERSRIHQQHLDQQARRLKWTIDRITRLSAPHEGVPAVEQLIAQRNAEWSKLDQDLRLTVDTRLERWVTLNENVLRLLCRIPEVAAYSPVPIKLSDRADGGINTLLRIGVALSAGLVLLGMFSHRGAPGESTSSAPQATPASTVAWVAPTPFPTATPAPTPHHQLHHHPR
jgi:hypothetical protein